ncbi:MAG: hypothetical protein PWR24_302 [Desulfonauticus sp.]|nr:MAG: hypothetical protein XD41_1994 [Desulfonauticus sp. 38_4375]MDK2920745.1 hypothetical protein [Desulfonauticus sp.]
MSTIMDQKRVEQAIRWIDGELQEKKDLTKLLEEVGMRFNLSPQEMEFVLRFFKEEKNNK